MTEAIRYTPSASKWGIKPGQFVEVMDNHWYKKYTTKSGEPDTPAIKYIGHDANGTEIEVVTLPTTDGQLVIHAMPYDWQSVTRKARDLAERRNKE